MFYHGATYRYVRALGRYARYGKYMEPKSFAYAESETQMIIYIGDELSATRSNIKT